MKTKRILTLLLCVAMLLTTVFAATSCNNAPKTSAEEKAFKALSTEEKFSASVNTTANQVAKWNGLSALTKVLSAGSVQLKLTLDENLLQAEGVSADIDGKFYLGSNSTIAADVSFKAGETTLSAKAWMDPAKSIVVDSQSILGGAYGIDLSTLAADIDAFPAFAEMDEEDKAQVMQIFNMISEYLTAIPEIISKRDETAKAFFDLVMKSVTDNLTLTAESKTVKVLEKDIEATCLTCKIDNETVAKILESIFANFKNDTKIKPQIEKVYPMFLAMLAQEDLVDAESVPATVDEALTMLDPMIKSAADSIRNAETKFSADLALALNKIGAIMRIDVTVTVDSMPVSVAIELGENLGTFEGFALTVNANLSEGVTMTAGGKITVEDTNDSYKLNLTTNGLDAIIGGNITASYERSKKDGATKLLVQIPGADEENHTFEANFNYKIEKGTHTISGLSIKLDGEAGRVPLPVFTLILKESDTMPAAPTTYTKLLKMTADEIQTLVGTVMQNVSPIMEFFGFEEDEEGEEDKEPTPYAQGGESAGEDEISTEIVDD